jgi:hypothetical protein
MRIGGPVIGFYLWDINPITNKKIFDVLNSKLNFCGRSKNSTKMGISQKWQNEIECHLLHID